MNLYTVTKTNTKNDQSYSEQTDPYICFSTKTSYFPVNNEDTKEIKFEGKARLG